MKKLNMEQARQVEKVLNRLLPKDAPGHQAIWLEVICQAIRDLSRVIAPRETSRSNGYNKARRMKFVADAQAWLFSNSDDFKMVCDLAGVNPDYVHLLINEASHD